MSVYKPAKSRFYQYDFQYKGKRYTGSTGVATMRKAEEVERKVRADVALGLYDDQAGMTLDEAAGQWWEEVGKHLRTARDVERRLEILLRLMGPETRLVDITTRKVSTAIEKRRSETFQKAPDRPGKPAKRYPIKNATVNGDIIGMLRRILRRAETIWEVKPIPKISWRALTLKEPEPEVRLYTEAQQQAWLDQCDPVTRTALSLLLTYGLRLGELFFPPSAFDPSGPRLVINKRKRGALLLPLRQDHADDIAARVAVAINEGLETVWFEELVIPAAGRRERRVMYIPLTYGGIQARMRTAAKRAGLNMPRLIHGTRHHAGTMMLAKSGNLKLAQQLLGHADIKSTMRYAHAMDGALRNVLENLEPVRKSPDSPEPVVRRRAKSLKP